jgi:glucosamine kinase
MQVYLGVDGGGSKTRSLLVDANGQVIGSGIAGPSNVHHIADATLRDTLRDLIDQATANLDLDRIELAAACFGLSGLSTTEAKARLGSVLLELELTPTHGISIITDAEIALTGAFAGATGIILIAGTGSACFGKDTEGQLHRTGGWGSIADDAGSGSWMGQRALQSAVRQADQREEQTELQHEIFKQLKIESLDEIITRLHQPTLSKAELAALAPSVLNLAKAGDTAASAIIDDAITELATLVQTTQQKMQSSETRLALLGGLFEGSDYFVTRFGQQLADTGSPIQIVRPQLPATAGAVLEAYKRQHNTNDASFIQNLQRSMKS